MLDPWFWLLATGYLQLVCCLLDLITATVYWDPEVWRQADYIRSFPSASTWVLLQAMARGRRPTGVPIARDAGLMLVIPGCRSLRIALPRAELLEPFQGLLAFSFQLLHCHWLKFGIWCSILDPGFLKLEAWNLRLSGFLAFWLLALITPSCPRDFVFKRIDAGFSMLDTHWLIRRAASSCLIAES